MKNPTPLFAPVIAATLPEGAAKAAAAAEDDMLASGCSWILLWLLDGSWMAMACRVGEVGEVAKLRKEGLAFELRKELQEAKLQAVVHNCFQAKSGKGYPPSY